MSTLFNLRVPVKEKTVTHHPWEATIKDVYAPLIKTAHNSTKNLQYPKKTEKIPNKERVKFTIIGNRVTKEFIYCANLVKVMHKYRWKEFESPIIRGVTSLEWPLVWNELKIEHGDLAYCLKSQVAVLMNNKIIGGEPELRELIESKYVYHLCLDYYKESVDQFAGFVKSSGRPCAYMHISVDSQHIGTMIFMLYADILPHTSENFLRLCRTRRGGYSGTTIHRIVKDGWIQCGGYGLKSANLSCENFIIPHDKRGVLCMANNGRHNDCSTQFFVLLQPAPWMAYKYVAFGQLIDGDATLKQIENVPTWHESPTVDIVIHKAGILNLDCHNIVINKGTNEYIQGHIDDLVALGDLFIEALMEKVFLEIEFRRVSRFRQLGEGVEEETKGLHETKRFMRNKEDIQKQIEKSQVGNEYENNEFDVEVYEYEPEEYSYKRASPLRSPSFVRPEIPYYLPMTDVPYPGEVDSTYDLKKFLRGDYCLESDIDKDAPKRPILHPRVSFPSSLFNVQDEGSEEASEQSLDSDDEKEIRRYLKLHADRVSFGGGVIKTIARGDGKLNIFESARKSELITDDELRRLRLASVDRRQSSAPAAVAAPTANADRKVLISAPDNEKESLIKIKRRQTGFVRPIQLEKIQAKAQSNSHLLEEESHLSRKVRIDPAAVPSGVTPLRNRRQTGFVRASEPEDSDTEVHRQSVLVRLYDDVSKDEAGPTLKEYRPMSETHKNNFLLLTCSPNTNIRSEESNKEKYYRHSITVENDSFDNLMSMQHGKKCARKISSDYVNTIDQAERRGENSIRSIEFAKTRPSMSVLEYQKKNQKYQEEMLRSKIHTVMMPVKDFDEKSSVGGIRLPGDTPLYSLSES